MRRLIAAVVCGLAVLGGVGCQSFKYMQRDDHGGVIEVKASERDAAIAQLQQKEGDVTIENIVPKGKPGQQFDPKAPVQPSDRMATTATSGFGSLFASRDEEKIQIKYTKKPMGTAAGGLPLAPKEDGVSQAGFQTNRSYDRTPGAGMATVGGQKSSSGLPPVDFNGYTGGK